MHPLSSSQITLESPLKSMSFKYWMEFSAFWSYVHSYCIALTLLMLLLPIGKIHAQDTEPPMYEFRGAWIATVYKLDWPTSNVELHQKRQMVDLLDYLKDAGINAVFFQVRSVADAMYESSYEPWSHYLTGSQSTPATYDPLTFVIEEAHRRGMELHAWVNPYRAHNGSAFQVADNHVTKKHPEWTYRAGQITWLDPGQKAVRDYVTTIVMDIARRYAIDGIHFDDYFYPYPPYHLTFTNRPDQQTFLNENRGFTNINAWRRDNINLHIAQVSDSLRTLNTNLKFGVSPFGIWKNGVPSGIFGLDAYNRIFADPIEWIQSGTIDYLVPQLYWAFGGSQDYAKLSRWWASQAAGIHLYTGHALHEIGRDFSTSEVPNQVAFNRTVDQIDGSVFFRARFLLPGRARNFAQRIRNGLYQYPSLPPPMEWKEMSVPLSPTNLSVEKTQQSYQLTWNDFSVGRYAIYRVQSDTRPDERIVTNDVRNLIAITGEKQYTDEDIFGTERYWYFVRSVSSNSIQSPPTSPVSTSRESVPPSTQLHLSAYPTVFSDYIQIEYALQTPDIVSLQLFDSIGRNAATLMNDTFKPSGQYRMSYSSHNNQLPSGMYWLVLTAGDQRRTHAIIHSH